MERKETCHEAQEMMRRIAGGDQEALCSLIRDYRSLVHRTALKITGNTADAEEVTQDVFIKVWERASGYDSRFRISTWLYRITCNISISRLRKNRFRFRKVDIGSPDISGLIPEECSAEQKRIIQEEWILFNKAAMRLSPRQRTVFVLKEIECLGTLEICSITGMTPEQIKSNLYLARKAMKLILDIK